MARPGRLRVVTAVLLGLSAVAFAAGTAAERASHHESAPEAGALVTASPRPFAPPSPAVTPRAVVPAVAPSVSSSPSTTGLKAPEGSKEREAAERAARASATPRPAKTAVASPATPEATTSPAPALGSGAPEGTAAREAAERAGTGHRSQEAGERLFGVNTESTGLVALALAASVVLLVLVLGVPSGRWLRTVALAVAAFTGAATALDVREVLHQHDLGQTGLAAAAGGVALLHLLGLLAAGALFVRSDS